jgi:hypothetical protein
MSQNTLTEAQRKFAEHLRAAIANDGAGEYDTAEMHAAADALVDMRMLYTNRDGQPDLKGASFEYRRAVSDGLADAGVEAGRRSQVMAALRYHVGNRVRARFTQEQLADYGLNSHSPHDRQRAEREMIAGIVRVATNPRAEVTEPEEAVKTAQMAAQMLENIKLKRLTKADRKALELQLERIRHRVSEI